MREFNPKQRHKRGHRAPGSPRRISQPPASRDRDGPVILYGLHTVKAALENPARKLHRLLATENAARRLADDGTKLPDRLELVRPETIAALVGPDAVHQGLLAEADPLPSLDLNELVPEGIILIFDQITDPHNVGAILRSAAAFGVSCAVTTSRHSPEATGVLAKAASGALEYVPMVTVPNLARAIDTLKDKNVFVVGLDSSGEIDLATAALRTPLGLVLGAEGKGLRHLTRATCDLMARLELPGRLKSLNVSNAAALSLYIATTRIAGRRP
jgi:23S rRNA (guanosine2251-2'-O)-methyltransferase